MRFPESAAALVAELDVMFPEVVPAVGDSMEAIQRQAGKRELVQFLKYWRAQTQREAVARKSGRRA